MLDDGVDGMKDLLAGLPVGDLHAEGFFDVDDEFEDVELVRRLIRQHIEYTGSQLGARVLNDWDQSVRQFVKVMPREWRRVLELRKTGS